MPLWSGTRFWPSERNGVDGATVARRSSAVAARNFTVPLVEAPAASSHNASTYFSPRLTAHAVRHWCLLSESTGVSLNNVTGSICCRR